MCHSGVGCINRGIGKWSQGYWLGLTGSIEWVKKKLFFPILTHHMSLFEGFASSLSVLLQIDSKNKLLCLLLLCTKGQEISKAIFSWKSIAQKGTENFWRISAVASKMGFKKIKALVIYSIYPLISRVSITMCVSDDFELYLCLLVITNYRIHWLFWSQI